MKIATLIALAAALALAPDAATAKSKKRAANSAEAGHVACTKYGCFPIASNCQPQTQFDWWGNPTGYDQIVCRPRGR